jgi:uncharacterized protein YndB with AHSA1/START domain
VSRELSDYHPDCVIMNSRVFNAPVETVFEAWTDPVHLANWWGPAGFTNTFLEHDLKVGGRWKFVMHGPEKGNYPNECVFTHIEEPSFIAWQRISKPLFKVAASFEKIDSSKTQVTFRMLFDSAEECSKLKKYVPEKNEENFDTLEKELRKMNGSDGNSKG